MVVLDGFEEAVEEVEVVVESVKVVEIGNVILNAVSAASACIA